LREFWCLIDGLLNDVARHGVVMKLRILAHLLGGIFQVNQPFESAEMSVAVDDLPNYDR